MQLLDNFRHTTRHTTRVLGLPEMNIGVPAKAEQ